VSSSPAADLPLTELLYLSRAPQRQLLPASDNGGPHDSDPKPRWAYAGGPLKGWLITSLPDYSLPNSMWPYDAV